ncbi:MAG: winged helix-turn-helix domain-containing protein [Acidilobus sp.]|nr:winged helix-turn-helix domain-containing protein [Acidilobus sp.]MCG2889571.1 winged helix-turn-helix domain-containing protein [Acidilobus sp.]MCG2891638.1 winged helix-turn-helix domain-containing protein [Acidilobus sp.]MCI4460130.1 winged helix-turn-helix transcriptional regulator [Acidilobus sp.]NAZ39014.1 ArsR family transcriptional regulator [Acidilobus sp.]
MTPLDLERLLSSKGRLRVLKVLLSEGQANITRIVKETGLNHSLVERHLSDLVSMGIVQEKRYGRMRVFMVDLRDPKVSGLYELLRQLESL